ncbi:MAG: hypothetical protein A2W90_21955 [Bacteroidetes bacterium GWF2_42_66]|nr:MAG: hypothetical protein A2W92_04770 [Bacteroidetes bacterium GWA2_42_15]OFY03248.1 MAG: hypothetical protein A2W89_18905 [Bacteroidetes bacterium GWE2_42_39]OFY45702.1 MAG: hypothetical protein A2W90_21955 [Bacteroidetes bacterium GWF2_42_66]HBL77306.1 hypothetical protein [Prolixibacteraceae bacterium]HCR91951.1 hypothetical protein [Prolixibacteraceae bacterium]
MLLPNQKMDYLGASPRGIEKANAQDENGTAPRVWVLNQKENAIRGPISPRIAFIDLIIIWILG